MKAICYENTKTTIPNWDSNDKLEQHCPLGFAYEIDGFFVHFYGSSRGLYSISPGLTVLEKRKQDTLDEWVKKRFGAKNITQMNSDVGYTTKSIWRPGLFFVNELEQGLGFNNYLRQEEEQEILLLFQKLMDIFTYIEPHKNNINVYGHHIRELLLLACTEFESQCISILKVADILPVKQRYTTQDYCLLIDHCFLKEYKVRFKSYKFLEPIEPFSSWNVSLPTQSLIWYDAYNKTKHNRETNFYLANLEALLNAIVANIVLFSVRFGPYTLLQSGTLLSSYINQYISLELTNPDIKSFYIPKLKIKENTRNDFFLLDSYQAKFNLPWITTKSIISEKIK
jgi:hypothetical protein